MSSLFFLVILGIFVVFVVFALIVGAVIIFLLKSRKKSSLSDSMKETEAIENISN